MTLHSKHREWLEARAIDVEVALSKGLATTSDGGALWLTVPYVVDGKLVNNKYRLTKSKAFRMDEGAPLALWNLDCLDRSASNPENPVIITEGEMDALSAMTAGYKRVLSVPNGAPAKATEAGPIVPENDAARFSCLWDARAKLDQVGRFIIATDGDEPGRILASELVRRLGPERCRFVTYPAGCKDLNDVLIAYGKEGIVSCIEEAKDYPVAGLYRLDDFPEPPQWEPYRLSVPFMYDLWPVLPGTFTVITGYAGRGKTSLMMACIADLMRQGVNICMGSFETAVKPVLRDQLRQHIAGSNLQGLTPEKRAAADELIRDRLTIIAQQSVDDETDMSLETVLACAKISVLRDGAKVVILDPWNELEHKRGPDETETEYTGRAIRLLKRFARDYGVAVVVVAHPSKPFESREAPKAPSLYNISGSSHWANKADYGIVVHRPNMDSNITQVATIKVRMGLPGRMGAEELAWDWVRARYDRPAMIPDYDEVDA